MFRIMSGVKRNFLDHGNATDCMVSWRNGRVLHYYDYRSWSCIPAAGRDIPRLSSNLIIQQFLHAAVLFVHKINFVKQKSQLSSRLDVGGRGGQGGPQ